MLVKLCLIATVFFLFLFLEVPILFSQNFDINQLPKGANVTLPRSAKTLIPIATRVKLVSTDMPQSVRLTTINQAKGKIASLRISIYNNDMQPIKNINIQAGSAFLYSFEGLNGIYIESELLQRKGQTAALKLQVESDKPLQVSH